MTLPSYDWLDVWQLLPDSVLESGWKSLVLQLLADIDALIVGPPARLRLLQMKEKFGSLRFYYRLDGVHAATEVKIADMVRRSEEASRRTCLKCGDPGSVRDLDGWIVPTCDDHAERRRL